MVKLSALVLVAAAFVIGCGASSQSQEPRGVPIPAPSALPQADDAVCAAATPNPAAPKPCPDGCKLEGDKCVPDRGVIIHQ